MFGITVPQLQAHVTGCGGSGISMKECFFSNNLTDSCDWKVEIGQEVPQRRGSTMLIQLFFCLETYAHCTCINSPHPNSVPGGLEMAGVDQTAWKIKFSWETCTRLTIKGSRSDPLSFSSLSLCLLPQIWTAYAAGLTQDLRPGDLPSSLSLSPAFIPLLSCFVLEKCGYHIIPIIPHRSLFAGVGILLKFVVKIKGLWAKAFEPK